MEFKNKKVIVTGGAQGIGKEVVRGIVDGGGFAIIADINKERAMQTVEEFSPNAEFEYIDLGDKDSIVSSMNNIIERNGKIDALVNCGGVISAVQFKDLTFEEWERTIRINLTGCFNTISSIYNHFIENDGGRIVNVSSVAGKIGGGLLGTAAYASSKAGLNGLTKAVAKEGGKYGISCNAVCPSFTNTEMTKQLSEDKEKSDKVISMIPLGRRAEPSEIAQMILFFASDLASFVNGEIGDCDGGIVLD
ncbi:SDR family NAD(P)-dependent oxidoreductase [Helcococcus bovis]|uniref:SDR family NAD(P)-dependent oxidoreductase n=1 Tax=Helcococcus bovis TaxID=3153252 RepID=UPI0038BC6B03